MREQIETSHKELQEALQRGLQEIDFYNREQSLLINGGPGLGKSHAVISDWFYQMICDKLRRPNSRILILESRSTTKEQLRQENTNENIGIYHYSAFEYNYAFNYKWDLLILDEAHSIFTDSAFADKTSELFDWLCNSRIIPVIFITANDVELIQMLDRSTFGGDIVSIFPNYQEEHLRHIAEVMAISLTTDNIKTVIRKREEDFLLRRRRGVFFVRSAAVASELSSLYNSKGYRCGFYISQYNKSLVVQSVEVEDDEDEELSNYSTVERKIDVRKELDFIEKQRAMAGKETIYDSIVYKGMIPDDIDYLFVTDVAQEGVSLSAANNLDFIFIEDTYPLTFKQKMFRYRENAPFIFLCLSQRRIEKLLRKEIDLLEKLNQYSQQELEAYALGAGISKNKMAKRTQRVWYNPRTKLWEVRSNYLAYTAMKFHIYEEVRQIIIEGRLDDLKEIYGSGARTIYIEIPEKRFEAMLEDWDGRLLGTEEKDELVQLAKKCGITNQKKEYDYTWKWLRLHWEEITTKYKILDVDKQKNKKRYKNQLVKNEEV